MYKLQMLIIYYIFIVVGDDVKNNVKFTRMKQGITQEQLAKKVHSTRQTKGLIEKGKYNPSLQLCISIAKALNKTLDQLFWEVEEE